MASAGFGGLGGGSTYRPPSAAPPSAQPQMTTTVTPNPQVKQQQQAVQNRTTQVLKNPTSTIPNYNNLVGSYNKLMGTSVLPQQEAALQATARGSEAAGGQAITEDMARRGLVGSGVEGAARTSLADATERSIAGGETELQKEDVLRKQGLLATGTGISALGEKANTDANALLLGGLPTATAGAQLALGQGQLGLEEFSAENQADVAQKDLALRAQQQQIAAELAMMQAAGNLFV